MKDEFYICNLLRSSKKDWRFVAETLGWLPGDSVIEFILKFYDPDLLKEAGGILYSVPSAVFVKLRELLDTSTVNISVQTSRKTFPPLNDSDLQLLTQDQVKRTIGHLLECDAESALQALFDPNKLRSLLSDADISYSDESDVESLLYNLLAKSNRPALKACLGTSLSRWSRLPSLVKDRTRQILENRLTCQKPDILKALVDYIKNPVHRSEMSLRPSVEAQGERFDAIALSRLHRDLKAIEDEFIGYAHRASEQGSTTLRDCRHAELIYPLIEYYIRGHYRTALDSILSAKEPLRQILSNYKIQTDKVDVADDAKLQVISGTEPNSLIVRYRKTPDDISVELLKLSGLTQQQCEHIIRHMPTTVKELDTSAVSLHERILNTTFPALDPIKAKIREALQSSEIGDKSLLRVLLDKYKDTLDESNDDTILKIASMLQPDRALDSKVVQCFVLSGVNLHPEELARLDAIKIKLDLEPYKPFEATDRRIEFPLGPVEIANKILDEYKAKGKVIKPIPQQANSSE